MGKIEYQQELKEKVIIAGETVGSMTENGRQFYCYLNFAPLGVAESLSGAGPSRREAIIDGLRRGRKEQSEAAQKAERYRQACDWLEKALQEGA
jgi:hypothetical protein